jgi:hypothetical protein
MRLRQISERIPAGRWGEPADFVGPIVFLASSASRYVCGELLVVDGVSPGSVTFWRLKTGCCGYLSPNLFFSRAGWADRAWLE